MSESRHRAPARLWAVGLLSLVLLGCASAPSPQAVSSPDAVLAPFAEAERDLRAQVGGRLYRLDAEASQLRIHVFRAGRAAALGHNHVLSAPRLQGLLWWPLNEQALPQPRGGSEARFELQLRLDELLLDPPELRAALGPGWASVLSPEAVAATRRNMLGEQGLQAERFPELRIQGLSLIGEPPKLIGRWRLSLHGVTRTVEVPLHVELSADQVRVTGAWVLRQSEFGLQPFSVAGGLLAVQDELLVEFDLRGR